MLFRSETLPTDLDGDGQISQSFVVAGRDTGVERFNPEWLFKTPGRIQGPIQNAFGETVMSCCVENLDEAYGQLLPYRIDSDEDGWPDVWDVAPMQPGYKDGVNN